MSPLAHLHITTLTIAVTLICLLIQAATASPDSAKPFHRRQNQDVTTSELPELMVASAWYAGWHVQDFPISQIPWSKYNILTYAFAVTTPDDSRVVLMESDQELLRDFVSAAHQHNVKASLSIGGWTGSRWFSSHVADAENRTSFVHSVVDLVQDYELDGIDIDWEYPATQGIGCNVVNPDDTSNFLQFLQELRADPIGSNLVLSAATTTRPFNDSSSQPSADLSGFSQVLDYITIMNYDTKSTPSSGAGPNAPLDDSCAPSDARFGSATSAVRDWTAAGIPAHQIVLGVPAYGHSKTVAVPDALPNDPNTLAAFPHYDPDIHNLGDRWDGSGGLDVCGVQQLPGGVYTYWGLIEEEFLNDDGSPGPGIVHRFDDCSQTPFVYHPGTQIFVSYDDPHSFALKGSFIKANSLRGFSVWEAGGDRNNVLLNSILNATIFGEGPTVATANTTSADADTPSSPSLGHPSMPLPSHVGSFTSKLLGSALILFLALIC